MDELDRIASANEEYAAAWEHGDLGAPGTRGVAVLTCMDARIDPLRALGLELGEAHVLRNAGGRVSEDALRSLAVSSRVRGTSEVLVIHHTACGMQTTDEALRERLGGAGPEALLTYDDLDESVREDVAMIEDSGVLAEGTRVSGWVFDVATGSIRRVVPAD